VTALRSPSRAEEPSGTLRIASEAIAGLGIVADRQVVIRAMRTGMVTWPSFILLDAYMCFVAYPNAPFWLFVVYRVLVELLFLGLYRAAERPDAEPRTLFRWLSLCFSVASFTIALMAIPLGGIRSPYMHGISLVALVWAALIPTHWRRGFPTLLQIGLAFPVVMAIGAAVSPASRAEWLSRDALITFAANYVFVLSSAGLSAVLSHMVWNAQQQARNVGSYELEELLGRGGMGEVWRARHHLLARRAAIKLIRAEALGSDAKTRESMTAQFEREAQATASLRSPHTINLYDFGVSETGAFYYVMELLVGRDMESLVRNFGPQPAERVLYLLEQVCESLGEAHAVGLVHRDVKPSNIYVCRMGLHCDFVKVLDFGLARHHRADSPDTQQTVARTMGTPAYMAPEVIMGGRADARCDIYALGCVGYFLLTGARVFEADTPMKALIQHVHDTPVPPSQRTELAIPPELDDLILRCLEKDPERRPQNADELRRLARASCQSGTWNREQARAWWETHLPELMELREAGPGGSTES
jgi:serine/threonine-protein kinase